MPTNLITTLLKANAAWTPADEGFVVTDRFESHLITDDDLNQIHLHLASAMRLMFEIDQELPSRNVYLLVETLMSRIKFRTVGGDMVAITKLSEAKVSEGFVTIKGSGYCYYERSCPLSGKLLPIPLCPSSHLSLIPRDWFDMEHPGWKQRFQAALDLNCTLQEATESLFLTMPAPVQKIMPDDLSM